MKPDECCLLPGPTGDYADVSHATVLNLPPDSSRWGRSNDAVTKAAVTQAASGVRPFRTAQSDHALVEAVRQQDPLAGEQLYDELIDAVDRAVLRVLGPGQPDHDDVVQATFEQLVLSLGEGRFRSECSLRSWAGSIASHLALNALRARCRERRVFDRGRCLDDESERSPDPRCMERDLDSRRQLDRLRLELGNMSAERAEALVLYHVQGHDLKEVAVLLGVSVAAAQSRLVRGRHELQKRMQRHAREFDV